VCARTTLSKKALRDVAEELEVEFSEEDALTSRPRYNAASGETVSQRPHISAISSPGREVWRLDAVQPSPTLRRTLAAPEYQRPGYGNHLTLVAELDGFGEARIVKSGAILAQDPILGLVVDAAGAVQQVAGSLTVQLDIILDALGQTARAAMQNPPTAGQ
jgi:hypothetical protein